MLHSQQNSKFHRGNSSILALRLVVSVLLCLMTVCNSAQQESVRPEWYDKLKDGREAVGTSGARERSGGEIPQASDRWTIPIQNFIRSWSTEMSDVLNSTMTCFDVWPTRCMDIDEGFSIEAYSYDDMLSAMKNYQKRVDVAQSRRLRRRLGDFEFFSTNADAEVCLRFYTGGRYDGGSWFDHTSGVTAIDMAPGDWRHRVLHKPAGINTASFRTIWTDNGGRKTPSAYGSFTNKASEFTTFGCDKNIYGATLSFNRYECTEAWKVHIVSVYYKSSGVNDYIFLDQVASSVAVHCRNGN